MKIKIVIQPIEEKPGDIPYDLIAAQEQINHLGNIVHKLYHHKGLSEDELYSIEKWIV